MVICHESSPFIWPSGPPSGCLGCCSLEWQWPLVWDSWPLLSFALPDQPPPPDHLENHLIWVDSIKVIPLAWCRMSLERVVGTCKIPTTLVMLSLQLWILLTLCNSGQSHLNLFQERHSWFIYIVHSARVSVISCIVLLLLFDCCCLIIYSSFVQLLFHSIVLFDSTFIVHCSRENIQFWS